MKAVITFILLFTSINLLAQDSTKVPSVILKTLNGSNVDYKTLIKKNHLTVVSFWATWCKPCKEEIEAINDLIEEWHKTIDFEFIAISIDDSRTTPKVKPFVIASGWNFPVYLDVNQSLQKIYNFAYIPQMIIYDGEGNVVYTHTGYKPGEELELFETIKKLQKQ